ncbi:MAG: hypothetical protein JSV68_15905 [Anaerolineaceae bacterium]|nr:MAG: hypothetical protein JSV68_15905 [Anaerolineaceae bacterium]
MILKTLYTLMANWIVALVSLLAFLVIGRHLLAIDKDFRSSGDPSVVKLELAYKKELFTAILKTWIKSKGDGAIPAFRRQCWYDNLWAITYAALFSSVIATVTIRFGQEPGTLVLLLFALPMLAALFDIFPENSLYIVLLRDVRSDTEIDGLAAGPILVASIAATIKFALLGAAFVGFVWVLLSNL